MTESIRLAEMTREEIQEAAPRATAVIPMAATEQHGPHLPINVDTTICEHVAIHAAETATEAEHPIYVIPMLPFGISEHHRPFAGVLSLSNRTFMAAVREVAESLLLSGFRRLFFLNGHGGNQQAMSMLAQELTCENDILVASASYWNIAGPALSDAIDSEHIPWVPGHAGAFETALMMALREDLINKEAFPAGSATSHESIGVPGVAISRYQWLYDIDGYTDYPARADRDLGLTCRDIIVQEVAAALRAFAALE